MQLGLTNLELQRALAATGDDPIRWLEERMTAPERQASAASGGSEILHSLLRVLEATETKKRRKRRVGTKK